MLRFDRRSCLTVSDLFFSHFKIGFGPSKHAIDPLQGYGPCYVLIWVYSRTWPVPIWNWVIKTWGDERTVFPILLVKTGLSETGLSMWCFPKTGLSETGLSIRNCVLFLAQDYWNAPAQKKLLGNGLVLSGQCIMLIRGKVRSGPWCVRQWMQAVSAICKRLESLCLRVSLAARQVKEWKRQWFPAVSPLLSKPCQRLRMFLEHGWT